MGTMDFGHAALAQYPAEFIPAEFPIFHVAEYNEPGKWSTVHFDCRNRGMARRTAAPAACVQLVDDAQEADVVLTVVPNYAEMYLPKGLNYCNTDDYKKAEQAYSSGLKVDPTFTMLYFLRAEVRGRLGDVTGAAADLAIVGQSDISADLKPYIEAAGSGQFSCKDMLSSR